MKTLAYVLRHAFRKPLGSILTILSIAICMIPVMFLVSYFRVNEELAASTKGAYRLITMNRQGLGGGSVPISLVAEVDSWKDDGVIAATPFSWFGGKIGEERADFAQFGVNADKILMVWDELILPKEQGEAFAAQRSSCLVGIKLAEERGLKVGDKVLLEGDIYPIDLDMEIAGIYDGPREFDRRMVLFHWDYMEEALKASPDAQGTTGNAGTIFLKCVSAAAMPKLVDKIDGFTANSDTPTRTQDEEAFSNMFMEMIGDFRYYLLLVGLAVVFVLLIVAGVAMGMSTRERTTEIAVLKAIGFPRGRILMMVLLESILVAGVGGALGCFGMRALFQVVDGAKLLGGFLPTFYIPWPVALSGFGLSLAIGLFSGLFPAIQASRLSVINGLRKVV